MSRTSSPTPTADRLAAHVGLLISDARVARHWTLRGLADRSGMAPSSLHAIEHGRPATLQTYAAIAAALSLDLRLDLVDPRRRAASARAEDPVHAAMGELIAGRLNGYGRPVAIDEPYQHFQFSGRADVMSWDLERRALIHVENRTRFPNLQDAIGSYNAKRRYLPATMAERLRLRGGWASVTNVMVGLWSSEVLHVTRLRRVTFRSICPDPASDFLSWWSGSAPAPGPSTSTFVLFDPTSPLGGRQRMFVDLDSALEPSARPRLRGYADALERLSRSGRA